MALLAIPALSAWTWHTGREDVPVEATIPGITQSLPVEIISAETTPKWILVPIDPS